MKYNVTSKTNRFAKRTLAAFSETLFQLLEQKSFENITVNELCTCCQYPRATFYNYFEDIYDLLDYCWSIIWENISWEECEQLSPKARNEVLFTKMYQFMEQKSEQTQKICRHNKTDGVLINSLRNYTLIKTKEIMMQCPHNHDDPVPFEMIAEHYCNTVMLVIEWCFLRQKSIKMEEAKNYIHYLLRTLEREGE